MTRDSIVAKLDALLKKGIESECDALYLMVEVRKLLEQKEVKKQYKYLTFQCNWAVHSVLTGTTALELLKLFDEANTYMKNRPDFEALPNPLKTDLRRFIKMESFEQELDAFFKACDLPTLDSLREDGWTRFMHLYVKVIEDSPLKIRSDNTAAGIDSVTLSVETVKDDENTSFNVRWLILDKNGLSGRFYVLNSFRD